MRKYIIVPVLLAVVLVMMCHCTSDRKATVPANEYLIQGELANLSDSIVIGLYVDEGNIFNLVCERYASEWHSFLSGILSLLQRKC